ncbi:hypothetical protein DL546_003063 [Coniochaeta pulveracea]|uniref:Uncharacterized protein n=1 Tax=Coniochaeta pulveracea TaxID=177199 RepID=A0A420Y8W4_9PEZI|nr:hypothetical protein DL546_003063 [Coniochaeta pulveracea]
MSLVQPFLDRIDFEVASSRLGRRRIRTIQLELCSSTTLTTTLYALDCFRRRSRGSFSARPTLVGPSTKLPAASNSTSELKTENDGLGVVWADRVEVKVG